MTDAQKINHFIKARRAIRRGNTACRNAMWNYAMDLPEKMWADPPCGDLVPITTAQGSYLLENPELYPEEKAARGAYGEPLDPGKKAEWSANKVWLLIDDRHPSYPHSEDRKVIKEISGYLFDPDEV